MKKGSVFKLSDSARKSPWVLKHPQDSVSRRYFKSKADAVTFAENLEHGFERFGITFRSLDPDEVRAFFHLSQLCAQKGTSLSEAVKVGLEQIELAATMPKLSGEELRDAFLAGQVAAGNSDATVAGYRGHCNRFLAAFPGAAWARVKHDEVQAFFDALNDRRTMQTGALRCLRVWWRWCMKRKRTTGVEKDLFAEVLLPKVKVRRRISFLSVEQAAGLLDAARDVPGAIVPVALGLFAGVRPQETARLQWRAINFKDRLIRIDEDISKTGAARTIEGVPAALWRHLPKPEKGTRLDARVAMGARELVERARKLADERNPALHLWDSWPPDALRHSFATYYVALKRNFPLVQAAMGHAGIAMLRNNYDGVTTTAEGKRFFAL